MRTEKRGSIFPPPCASPSHDYTQSCLTDERRTLTSTSHRWRQIKCKTWMKDNQLHKKCIYIIHKSEIQLFNQLLRYFRLTLPAFPVVDVKQLQSDHKRCALWTLFSHTHPDIIKARLVLLSAPPLLSSLCGGGCWLWLVSAVCKVAHAML